MIILKIAIITFITWKIFWYICYYLSTILDNIDYAKMKWSMIKKLYPINPDKWSFDDTPRCCSDFKMMCNLRYNDIPIALSFFDYQKLKYYVHKHGETSNVKALALILEDVQEDIEEKRKQAQREIDEAQEIIKNIIKSKEIQQ